MVVHVGVDQQHHNVVDNDDTTAAAAEWRYRLVVAGGGARERLTGARGDVRLGRPVMGPGETPAAESRRRSDCPVLRLRPRMLVCSSVMDDGDIRQATTIARTAGASFVRHNAGRRRGRCPSGQQAGPPTEHYSFPGRCKRIKYRICRTTSATSHAR